LKKVGKTSRPFRYDLNQIHYYYTVQVTNRFEIISDRQMIKPILKKMKCKKAKWLSEEALQIAEKRRKVKGKSKKERYIHLNVEFQRTAGRDTKTFLSAKK